MDIDEQPGAPASYRATLDEMACAAFHATDEAGRLIVGAEVAIATWRLTPGEGGLSRCSVTA